MCIHACACECVYVCVCACVCMCARVFACVTREISFLSQDNATLYYMHILYTCHISLIFSMWDFVSF